MIQCAIRLSFETITFCASVIFIEQDARVDVFILLHFIVFNVHANGSMPLEHPFRFFPNLDIFVPAVGQIN